MAREIPRREPVVQLTLGAFGQVDPEELAKAKKRLAELKQREVVACCVCKKKVVKQRYSAYECACASVTGRYYCPAHARLCPGKMCWQAMCDDHRLECVGCAQEFCHGCVNALTALCRQCTDGL